MSSRWRVSGVLAILAAAVALPIVGSGFLNLRLGLNALRASDYAEASLALERVAYQLPWRTDLRETAGMAAYSAGDQKSALRLLDAARHRNALTAMGWEVLGAAHWANGDPSAALQAWLEGASRFPGEPALWDDLAGLYHAQGDFEGEQRALERRIGISDDPAARYRLGLLLMFADPRAARETLEAAVSLNPAVGPAGRTLKAALDAAERETDPARKFIVIGRSLGLVEEWALAGRAFQRAAEADPLNAEARAWLGEARQHLDQNGRPDLDAAMSIDPNSSVVHTLRGLYWRREGNFGMSLAEYTRAVQLDPKNPGLRALLGEAYVAGGDLIAALDAYETAVELSPADPDYWRMLALFSADNEVQAIDVGVAAGLKAVELAPRDPQALDALGWAYSQAGYLTKSEAALQEALKVDPGLAIAHVHLGITYLRWGQNDRAFEEWNTAIQLDGAGPAGQRARHLLDAYFPSN